MDAKTIAWVSYLTLIGWIIAFVSYGNLNPKSSLPTFHLRQSFGLILLGIASSLIFRMLGGLSVIGILSPIVWILLIVLWILGLLAAINSEEKPVPVIGTYFSNGFNLLNN